MLLKRIIHKLLGIRVSETDETRFHKSKEKAQKIRKERKEKEARRKHGNKNFAG